MATPGGAPLACLNSAEMRRNAPTRTLLARSDADIGAVRASVTARSGREILAVTQAKDPSTTTTRNRLL